MRGKRLKPLIIELLCLITGNQVGVLEKSGGGNKEI